MSSDEYFMHEAFLEAQKAYEDDEVPVGCVVVKDGVIIARGYNLTENNNDPTAHAEIIAIKKACALLDFSRAVECDIYVTSEPCIMCAGAIVNARIKRVVFGVKNEKFGGVVSLENILDNKKTNHHVEWVAGILEDEIRILMKSFFQSKRENK